MAKQKVTQRDMALVGLAIRHDVDSFDVEAACQKRGLDYNTADLRDVEQAVKAQYGSPASSSWLPWRRA